MSQELIKSVVPMSVYGVLVNTEQEGYQWYFIPTSLTCVEDQAKGMAVQLSYNADQDTQYIAVKVTDQGYLPIDEIMEGHLEL